MQEAAEPFGACCAEALQPGKKIVRRSWDRVEKRRGGGEQRAHLREQRGPQERQQPSEEKEKRQRQDQRGKAAFGGYLLGGALGATAGYVLGGDLLYGLEVYYKNGKADLIENIDPDAYKHIINCIDKRIVYKC